MALKSKRIIHELKEHIPFTIIATLIAILLVIILDTKSISSEIFRILHPAHILVSAIATSALFYIYKKNFLQAILIGITGSIIIGTMSDVIFPFLGGSIFSLEIMFHIPIIENPLIIFSTALIGSIIGASTKFTKLPHLIHVFLSVFASLFYLISFSQISTITEFSLSFIIVFIAVIIPCCISDIFYPLAFLKKN
jgi:hypothetical protein